MHAVCPVWYNSVAGEQSDLIESIQKRIFKIISGSSVIDYQQMCLLYSLPTLSELSET